MNRPLVGWYGVDLDGTLSRWDQGSSINTIGEPLPRMVERVKGWLAQGFEVRIVTARVGKCGRSNDDGVVDDEAFAKWQEGLVKQWCLEHLGQELEVTCSKDFRMIQLWDDRVVEVMTNTGLPRHALGR